METEPMLEWHREGSEWNLRVRGKRTVATVFDNGTWHTWDKRGNGGENASESTVTRAKIEAAAAAIAQGFI